MADAFVCFCVDGKTDIDALHYAFEEMFDRVGGDHINVAFRLLGEGGDITSQHGVTPDNIERSIYKYYFREQDRSSGLGWDDLTTLIHIIDLDGAYTDETEDVRLFTPEEAELAEILDTKTLYLPDHIAVREKLVERRRTIQRKRQNIEALLKLENVLQPNKKMKRVNYRLYYFSSNMDHFLHGDANMITAEKVRKATEFSKQYGDADGLAAYFLNNPLCPYTDYNQSWKAIQKRNRSLSPASNLNILVDEIQNSTLEDWL